MFYSEQTPLLPRLEEVSAFDEALTSGKVYVLLFGLSIHSLFEGLGNCFHFSAAFVHVRFRIRVYVRVCVGPSGLTHGPWVMAFAERRWRWAEMKQNKVIGFEKDHGGMWTVLITILVHKSLLAFSLGLSAFKVFHHFKNCLYAMIIFCISRIRSQTKCFESYLRIRHFRTSPDAFRKAGPVWEQRKVQLVSLLEHFWKNFWYQRREPILF